MNKKIKQVICKSGLSGYQCHLRDSYNDFNEFKIYSEMFGFHKRLGYKTVIDAWQANPVIQGSVIPSDFCKVNKMENKFDLVSFIMDYENGQLDEDAIIEGFQHLIDDGTVWELQGHYGRMAKSLIEAGHCHL